MDTNHTIVNGWVSDASNTRGTFSIISSCVLTLSLCVYTAIHLNVENRTKRKTTLKIWLHTTQWVVLGVFAPELLCYIAWRQWISARSVSQTVEQMRTKNDCSNHADISHSASTTDTVTSQSQLQWSAAHSYYACMGGFVVDFDDEYRRNNLPFTAKVDRLTLTPRGVRLLIECGHMPSISKEEILDKSKSDAVAKLLSALQAGWFAIQMISRHRAGLQITLLELNTMAHVVCAVFIYALWWQKPKAINEPTKIQGPWLGPILAFMFMNSRISGWKSRKPGILMKTWEEPEFSILTIKTVPGNTSSDSKVNTVDGEVTASGHESHAGQTISITPQPTEEIIGVCKDKKAALSLLESRIESAAEFQKQRWLLAAEAIRGYEPIRNHLKPTLYQIPMQIAKCDSGGPNSSGDMTADCHQFVKDAMSNWTDDSLLRDGISGVAVGAVLWSLSILYGGLHAVAWLDYFPSYTEQCLWRISCVWIAGSGGIWVTINLMAQLNHKIYSFWESVERLEVPRIVVIVLGGIATICGMGYVLARAFLVVEAFISLRSMPQDVYYTPDWVKVIPHL